MKGEKNLNLILFLGVLICLFIGFIWFSGIVDTSLNPFMRSDTQFEGMWITSEINSEFLANNLTFNFFTDEHGLYRAIFSMDGKDGTYLVHSNEVSLRSLNNSFRDFTYVFSNSGRTLTLTELYGDHPTVYVKIKEENISWSPNFVIPQVILTYLFLSILIIFITFELVLQWYKKNKKK
jgi:hypothetical protein